MLEPEKENKMVDERMKMLDEGTNFFEWQSEILKVLRLEGVQDVITGETNNRRKNEKAAFLIIKNVSPKFTSNMQYCKTAKEMMLKLESHFCYKTVFEKLRIKKQILNLNSEPFENLQSHFHKFDALMSKLKDLNCEMDETNKVFHLLFTLLDRYDTLIFSLDKSFRNALWEENALTSDCIKTTLLDYEAALSAEMCIKNDGNASLLDCEEKDVLELCGDLAQQSHDQKHICDEAGQFSQQISNDNSRLEQLQNTCNNDQLEHYSDIISYVSIQNEDNDDCSLDVKELEDEGSGEFFDEEVCKTEHESMCVLKESEILCQRVLESHVLLRDIAKDLHCLKCDKWFLTPTQLTQHKKTHNISLTLPYSLPPNRSDTCRETTAEIRSPKVIQFSEKPVTPILEDAGIEHIEIQLPTVAELSETPEFPAAESERTDTEYQCNYCKKAFKMIINLNTHIAKCHIERPYYCHICRKPFDRKDLEKHLKTHDDIRVDGQELSAEASTTEITDSSTVYTTFNAFNENDIENDKGVCDICGRPFGSRFRAQRMLVHRDTHIGFKTYACDLCDKLFSHEHTLKTHIQHEHSLEKPYACEVCGIKFAVKMFYQRHKLTHTGRNYPCKLCEKTYSRQSHLNDHVIQRHEKRCPFVCFVCGKGFSRKVNLRRHSQIHTGNSSVSKSLCPICGKSISTVKFKIHCNKHNKEFVKRFECDICGYKTGTKCKLSEHMSKHSTDKPYKCNVCKKRFRLKMFLDRHKPIHAKDGQKYSCSVCGQRFFHKHTLARHMRTPHSDRTPRLKVSLKE